MTAVLFLIVYVSKYVGLQYGVSMYAIPSYFLINIYVCTRLEIFDFFLLVITCNFVEMLRIINCYVIICIAFSEKLDT